MMHRDGPFLSEKTLRNHGIAAAKNTVPDLEVWGDGDMWKLLCKASSENEGWMKSTKALEIEDHGCLVQVTTQQGQHVAEAVCFVPGVCIVDEHYGDLDSVVRRHLAPIYDGHGEAIDLRELRKGTEGR